MKTGIPRRPGIVGTRDIFPYRYDNRYRYETPFFHVHRCELHAGPTFIPVCTYIGVEEILFCSQSHCSYIQLHLGIIGTRDVRPYEYEKRLR